LKTKLKYHIPFYLLCLAIFTESSFPSKDFPKIEFELADKLVHFAIYFVLLITAYYSFGSQNTFGYLNRNSLAAALIFTAVFGASDEIHQYFVPGRSCEFYDWVADIAGGVFAVALLIFKKFVRDKKYKMLNPEYDTNK
jgi:VanZ family protein